MERNRMGCRWMRAVIYWKGLPPNPSIRFRPTLFQLEDRFLLSGGTATLENVITPPSLTPVGNMMPGSAGDLWYQDIFSTKIGHISSQGVVQEFPSDPQASYNSDPEMDPFGNLWIAVNNPEVYVYPSLSRFTPSGVFTENTWNQLTVAKSVNALATPPDGFLPNLTIDYGGRAYLVGIYQDGSDALISVPIHFVPTDQIAGVGPLPIVQGSDGAFWYPDGSAIDRLTPDGQWQQFPLPAGNTDSVVSIAAGSNGNLWFLEDQVAADSPYIYYSDKIGSISTTGTITEFSLANLGTRLKISTFVPATDGSIWFTEQGYESDDATRDPNAHFIGHIDTSGNIIDYTLPPDSNGWDNSTIGPNGTLWTETGFNYNEIDLQSSVVDTLTTSALASGSADVLQVQSGAGGNYLVATVNSSTPVESASVTWGDGTSSPATVAADGNGAFQISADPKYQTSGDFTYQVNVTNQSGVQTTVMGTAFVAPALNQHFISQLYEDLLQRSPDPSGLSYWSAQLGQGTTRSAVVSAILDSPEGIKAQVDQLYSNLLHRSADPAGEQADVNYLANGGSWDGLRAILLASPEYQQLSGGPSGSYIGDLYQVLLGRAIDPMGFAYWQGVLQEGSAADVVTGIIQSAEAKQYEAQALLENTLHRSADAAGTAFFAQELTQGTRYQDVQAAIFASYEYYIKADASGTGG